MAGLIAARVLSEFFEKVTIVERDNLQNNNLPRRGVPQGRHAHGILASGTEILTDLFPDLEKELVKSGAVYADVLNDGRWYFEGACLRRSATGRPGVMASRPLLESTVRRQVQNVDNIDFVTGRSIRELAFDGQAVKGVITEGGIIGANLTIDATGRGSKTPEWLRSIGLPSPAEERVEVQLKYTTRFFKRRSNDLDGDTIVLIPPTPEGKRGGVALAQEDRSWVVTLFGHFGHGAPEDLDGFIAYAKGLPVNDIYELIRDAEPVGEPATIRFPASVRRRYEKLKTFPDAFLVFGDAICSFNPIYGQGMSVAALQGLALKTELTNGNDNLARRFFNRAGNVIDTPWSVAVGTDLRMPETVGKRTFGVKLINWYMAKLHRCGHNDAEAARAFIKVAQLQEGPETLFRPSIVRRVFSHELRSRVGRENGITSARISTAS